MSRWAELDGQVYCRFRRKAEEIVRLNEPKEMNDSGASYKIIPTKYNYFAGSEGGAKFAISRTKPELRISGNLRDRDGDMEDVNGFITKFEALCRQVGGFGYLDVTWDYATRLLVEYYDGVITWNYINLTHETRYEDRVKLAEAEEE